MAHMRGLILPSYWQYFHLLIFANFVSGIFDISTSLIATNEVERINQWVLPIELGVFHVLSKGFALFLLRNGAGIGAFRHSLVYGSLWGLCTV